MSDYPKAVSKKITKKIYEQMDNPLFKLNENKLNFDICFLTYINYENNKIPVAIINNFNFDKENIQKLNVSINGMIKEIKLGEIKYKNKEYNISILELKEDQNNDLYFLELDENLFNKNYEIYYHKETIYTIQYNEKESFVSYGIILNINKSNIKYISNIKLDQKGFPIFNLSNNKVIGFHSKGTYYNEGIYFAEIINEFTKRYKYYYNKTKLYKIIKNDINILVKVDEKDINKRIYFINEKFNVLNRINTALSINNISSFP